MSRGREIKKIPIEKVLEGIDLCKRRALNYLDDAELLVNNPESADNAGLLTIHAIEELGKANILESRLKDAIGNENTFIQIGGRRDAFYSHPDKINAALNAMPEYLKTLTMGTFDPSQMFFQTRGTEISQDLKEYITYIEYERDEWTSPHTLNPEQLKNLIQGIKATLQ